MIKVLSLGAGVQSSTLALMAARGEIGPMPDAAIFADTQGEPVAVYGWLNWLETQLPFPVHRVSKGSLWEAATRVKRTKDGQRTYVEIGIPAFTLRGLDKGMGMRQCTRTFKIDEITKACRRLLGKSRVLKSEGKLVEMWIGISTDESWRMKPSQVPFIETKWPLIEAGMSRQDCLVWMAEKGYPTPPKSACTFCPYHDNAAWRNLTPDEFQDAVVKERELQAAYAQTTEFRGVPFLHASRVPLDQVDLGRADAEPDPFLNECEGMCGV